MIPAPFYRSDPRVLGLMIELNRSLYLDESIGEPLGTFTSVRKRLRALLRGLEAEARRAPCR